MFILLAFFACGSGSDNACPDDDTVLVEGEQALTCAMAKRPGRYIRLLAGVPLPAGSTAKGVAAVRARHRADPTATISWLKEIHVAAKQMEETPGLPGAELRSAAVYREKNGEGLLGDDFRELFKDAVNIRVVSDENKLALTEADIEGWITYTSLCHEVQSAGSLRVSIANRVDIYALVEDRFTQGNKAEQVALTSLGVVWDQVKNRWQAWDHEAQQAWVAAAPLPPPMSASSLGYLEAIVEEDVVAHAEVLHRKMGPLHFRDGAGYFHGEP